LQRFDASKLLPPVPPAAVPAAVPPAAGDAPQQLTGTSHPAEQ